MNSPIRLKTLANVFGIALLIAVVAPFVVYAVPAVVGAEYSFVVLTASMTPAIEPGDVVIVDERDPSSIAEGDVITFVRGDNEVPVTHRVIGVVAVGGEVAFETQGDANDAADAGLVPAANVLGVVAFTIPYLGYVIQFADSPVGFITLVVVPFGLLALSEVWSLYRARTASAESKESRTDAPAGDDESAVTAGSESGTAPAVGAGVAANVGADAASDSGFVVTERTVQGAVGILLAFAPYAAYVAYTLQSGLTIAIATGTSLGLLIGLVLLVTGRSGDTPAATDSIADSGDDRPDDESKSEGSVDPSPKQGDVFDDPVIEPVVDGGSTEEVGR